MWWTKKTTHAKRKIVLAILALFVVAIIVLVSTLKGSEPGEPIDLDFERGETETPDNQTPQDLVGETPDEGEGEGEAEDVMMGLPLSRFGNQISGMFFKYPEKWESNLIIKEKKSPTAGNDEKMIDLAVYYIDDRAQKNIRLVTVYMFKAGKEDKEKVNRPEVAHVLKEGDYTYVVNHHSDALDLYGDDYEYYDEIKEIVKESQVIVDSFEIMK